MSEMKKAPHRGLRLATAGVLGGIVIATLLVVGPFRASHVDEANATIVRVQGCKVIEQPKKINLAQLKKEGFEIKVSAYWHPETWGAAAEADVSSYLEVPKKALRRSSAGTTKGPALLQLEADRTVQPTNGVSQIIAMRAFKDAYNRWAGTPGASRPPQIFKLRATPTAKKVKKTTWSKGPLQVFMWLENQETGDFWSGSCTNRSQIKVIK
jgi:hypothetical protein